MQPVELSAEIRALQKSNHARLEAIAKDGHQLDMVLPYLVVLLEGLAQHAGILEEMVDRFETQTAKVLDQAEQAIAHEKLTRGTRRADPRRWKP